MKGAFNRPRHNKSLSIDLNLDTIDQDGLIPSGKYITLNTDQEDENAKALLLYAQVCFNKKKWEMLVPLITNTTEIKDPTVSLQWTERPRTVGSVALVYLGLGVKKYTTQVAPFIEVFLPVLLAFLKSGGMDQKENSIFLLYYYIDFASEKAFNKLITCKIFHLIARWMLSPKAELRKLTINLCYKIYKDRPQAKKDFIRADGAFYLVQLIGWNSNSDFLADLIRDLEEVIMEDQKNLIMENLNLTKEPLTLDILSQIDLTTRHLELKTAVEKLMKFYQALANEANSTSTASV
jgi:hypothetical protein